MKLTEELKLFRGYLAEANKNINNRLKEYKAEHLVATKVGHLFEKMYIKSKLDAIDEPLGELKFLLKQFDEYFGEKWANEFLKQHGLELIDNDRLKSDRHISSILNDYFTWHNSMGFVSHKPSDISEYIKYKHNERI